MKKFYYRYAVICACLLCACLSTAISQNWNQVLKLSAADRTTPSVAARSYDNFGNAMSSDGNYVAIGAPMENHDFKGMNPISNAGSVFVYQNTGGTWKIMKKLTAPDRMGEDGFGSAIVLRENTLVVGVPNSSLDANGQNAMNRAGAVYVFYKDKGGANNWGLVKKLVAPDRAISGYFGLSVTLSAGNLAVGGSRGLVYLFNQSPANGGEDWVLSKTIAPSDQNLGGGGGFSVAVLDNDLLAVAANYDALDANGANSVTGAGSVYLFQRNLGGSNNWGQLKKLVAPDRATHDRFGSSLALVNGLLVVGAPNEDEDANGSDTKIFAGSAYVYEQDLGGSDAWGFRKKLVAADRAGGDELGCAVAILGDQIILGAQSETEDANGINTFFGAGSAYVYGKNKGGANNWGQQKKLVAPDRYSGDFLGRALCTNGTMFFIGAPYGTTDAQGHNFVGKCGAVYQFDQNEGGPDNFGFRQKLVLIDLVPNQRFGNAVAIDGDYAVVSHPGDFSDATGQNHLMEAGSVWILKNSNGRWLPVKKLVPSERTEADYFGSSVAISGSIVVVGTPGDDEDASGANPLPGAGAAYVFAKDEGGIDNWGLVKKLAASDRAANDLFGTSVAINGSTIAAGAPAEAEDATGGNPKSFAGSVYLFYRDEGGANNWGQVKKVVAGDRTDGDYFGVSLSINDGALVAGAYYNDEGGNNAGAAYVFAKDYGGTNTWGQVKKLLAPDKYMLDNFGKSVAISGNIIVIGSYNEDEDAEGNYNKSNAGSAYLFGKDQGGANNWGFIKKLVPSDRQAGDIFGYTVAILDTTVVVGAPLSSLNAAGSDMISKAGAAYIFTKNQHGAGKWGMAQKITAADRGISDNFSYGSIALSGQTLLIGALYEDEDSDGLNGLDGAGSVYFFKYGCNNYSLATANSMAVSFQGAQATKYYDNNCALLTTVTPSGAQPIGGAVSARVWIESIQPVNYVLRHYEVTPYLNRTSATGRITLYFTQSDFSTFNTAHTLKLPTGTADLPGKARLLIEKHSGNSNDGSGTPGSYSGAVETIDPADNDIVWNSTDNRWEVSFDVTGFSGFFVKTTSNVLPLKWLNVQARLNAENRAEITWKVEEKDAVNYQVERSTTGMAFDAIGTVNSKGNGNHTYSFTETVVLKGYALYRIRQTDKQGRYTYSAIIELSANEKQAITLYPNPTKNRITVTVPTDLLNSRMQVLNVLGTQVMATYLTTQTTQIELSSLPTGIYLLRFVNGEVMRVVKQ